MTTTLSNPFAYLPELVNIKTENYYYATDGETEVSVYDQDLNCVFYWEVPFDEYDDSEIFLLSDGVLLAQVWELLPEDTEKYDVVIDGEKFNLTHYILNAEKDKVKEVDLDFMVDEVDLMDADYGYGYDDEESTYPEKMINWAEIYYINDQKIDSLDTEVTIKENGDVIELAPEFDNVPYARTENRWVEYRDNGEEYLIDEEGEVIGNITGESNYNEKFISTGTKLLNYDLEVVYDVKANAKKIVTMFETSVLLKDETPDSEGKTNYYLYKADGTITKIENYYDYESYYGFYVTYDSATSLFTFYSETGTVLTTVKGWSYSAVYFDYTENIVIVRVTDTENKTHYYKFS
jgi:hypothetical protein